MDAYPYDRQLVALVDDAFAHIDLIDLIDKAITRRYPWVDDAKVLTAFDSIFGGVTDVRIIDGGADDDLPMTADDIARGTTALEAWLADDKRAPRPRDGE
jgi:hypothetical protein